MKKMWCAMVAFLLGVMLMSCAAQNSRAGQTTRIEAEAITVHETGLADANLPDNQQRYLSRQAAIVNAERALRRAIETWVEGEVYNERGATQRDVVRERVSGVLRGAEITETRYEGANTCYVTMVLSKEKMQALVELLSAER